MSGQSILFRPASSFTKPCISITTMTDITERLRNYLLGDHLYHPLICDEAADEIERLRTALGEIGAVEPEYAHDWGCQLQEIARKALLSR